jgi:outer membrane protein assembly factor BamB
MLKTTKTISFALAVFAARSDAEPTKLHPDNPHYLLFNGQPTGKMITWRRFLGLGLMLLFLADARADWPTIHGNPQHTGFTGAALSPPFRLAWVRHFVGERLGTAMEPIVADGNVFVATHNGNLYALDAQSGEPLWRFQTEGSFLHSPGFADGWVVAGNTDGNIYALDAKTGKLVWSMFGGFGGFSASPVIAENMVFAGTRTGEFLAASLKSGKVLWRLSFPAPIRQTAAFADGRVFVTAEDLRVRCMDAANGTLLWTSEPLAGQSARDYYPIIVRLGDRTFIIVRTNPIINMGQQISRDRSFLCRDAGLDDSDWRKLDAWTKSDQARGTNELWSKEQTAIVKYLHEHREARSFFVLDASTGQEAVTAPVLWIAGCQGVGVQPALTAGGQLFVFYRSVYGNWNHGVAPLVALGLLDLSQNHITPLFHKNGKQPPWNTFWGTADESQNFVVAGNTAIIVHQGTLSGFDLKTSELFTIHGERDTYGGFRSPSWARNEWHGPGRGGVAIAGNRIYWLTGSRVLCLVAGKPGKPAVDVGVDSNGVSTQHVPRPVLLTEQQISQRLADGAQELLSKRWAPLFIDPGLAGRDFSFDDSGEWFEALAWAYPHLNRELQRQAKTWLAEEWTSHPPFTKQAWYSLKDGERREYFWTPNEVYVRPGGDRQPHPFANLYAVWLYGERCDEWKTVLQAWPQLKAAFDDFAKTNWRLDSNKGDLFANRYLASLFAFERIAAKAADVDVAKRAHAMAVETIDALIAWWQRAAAGGTLTNFNGSSQLDPFIGNGDAISYRLAPHRHKVALLSGLTPEVAATVRAKAPDALAKVWRTFETLYRTWPLAGEERQVHFGENFIDLPDLAMGGFTAMAWLNEASSEDLARRVDLPFCRADLYYLTKLALILEREKAGKLFHTAPK